MRREKRHTVTLSRDEVFEAMLEFISLHTAGEVFPNKGSTVTVRVAGGVRHAEFEVDVTWCE